jgi:hypothetical protein
MRARLADVDRERPAASNGPVKHTDAPRRADPESLALFGIVFSIACFVGAMATAIDQPAGPNGDTADTPGYWIATTVLLSAIGITILALSLRTLRRTSDED